MAKAAAPPAPTFEALATHHPNADTELAYRTPFELLVATVLSAQSTDRGVNAVTPALFARYPDAAALAAAAPAEVEPIIHATGFFRQKAKAIIGLSQALVDAHAGTVPANMDALVKLPGVGRKTANVVLGHALGVPGFPVDRHVLRVAGRLGWIHTDDAVKAEAVLTRLFPAALWTRVSDTLILHGRRICGPTPMCDACHARALCPYAVVGVRKAPAARARGLGRPAARPASASTRIATSAPPRPAKTPAKAAAKTVAKTSVKTAAKTPATIAGTKAPTPESRGRRAPVAGPRRGRT